MPEATILGFQTCTWLAPVQGSSENTVRPSRVAQRNTVGAAAVAAAAAAVGAGVPEAATVGAATIAAASRARGARA